MAFRMKSTASSWYGSEFSSYPGIGYPSCNRALSLVVRNTNDPNCYYAELGLLPWASADEIKRALRDVYRRFHPDGLTPNSEKFLRFQEIGTVLTDPLLKSRYDSTPPNQLFVDSEVLSILSESGIGLDALRPFSHGSDEAQEDHYDPFYDYYSEEEDPFDLWNAQRWYAAIIEVAPLFSYTKTIRLFITNDSVPVILLNAGIFKIPRGWQPSVSLAFGILTCCVVS